MIQFRVKKGKPKFGANREGTGVNFGLFSRNATKVILELFDDHKKNEPIFRYELDENENKTGDVWVIFGEGLGTRVFYGWRVDGPYDPKNGHRFNINKLLLDPYARAISGKYNYDDSTLYSYEKNSEDIFGDDLSFSKKDSGKITNKSIVVDDEEYNWEGDTNPRIPLQDTIIYEMHVRLFTMHPNSRVEKKGTYAGIVEKIEHLKELGITAIELLPVFEFNMDSTWNRNPVTGEKLRDVWGYNTIGFFAITGNYSYGLRLGDQVFEFKDFVKELHKAGIEVILDVVYNHTGEGNEKGPTLSFKGLDNSIYYLLEENKRWYSNYSGTGNTFNCSHTVVKSLIVDSLRYWVTEMHVDGFRFDLAAILGRSSSGEWIGDMSLLKDIADDPVISGSKLIAEGWDAAGGYFVGEFPVGWAEWNGKFRDTVRRFVKGDEGQVSDLATRLVGSPDLFKKFGRKPYHSINFITAHDGFTMWDLVSYNEKHNLSNGEENRDGHNDNASYNCGIEGETDNDEVNRLRRKQIKNFITILMISQGLPMMLMGDEMARTQNGNNNAYCQDNEITWVNWDRKDKFKDIFRFHKKMIEFRKKHNSLKREHFFQSEDLSGNGMSDITWHGVKLNKPDWGYMSHALAFMISGEDFVDQKQSNDNDIYVALNSYWEPLIFELPKLEEKKWYRVVDTNYENGEDYLDEPVEVGDKYYLKERSSLILISK